MSKKNVLFLIIWCFFLFGSSNAMKRSPSSLNICYLNGSEDTNSDSEDTNSGFEDNEKD